MLPALSQVCTLGSPFEKDVEQFAAGHVPAIEIWLGKLETYLETHSTGDVRALLEEHEMAAPVASFQGGLLVSEGAARQEAWDLFRRRLALCEELGIETLVVAADVSSPLTQQDLDRTRSSLAEAAALAGASGVRLALEFQASSRLANNLETCAALVAETGSPHLGVCFDLFHYHTGPSKTEDLELLTGENLFSVQLCDLSGVPREAATDADRVLPGDGDIPLSSVLDRLRKIGYAGCVSVEMMNPQMWQVPPRSFGEIGITALRKVLGQASMGSV